MSAFSDLNAAVADILTNPASHIKDALVLELLQIDHGLAKKAADLKFMLRHTNETLARITGLASGDATIPFLSGIAASGEAAIEAAVTSGDFAFLASTVKAIVSISGVH